MKYTLLTLLCFYFTLPSQGQLLWEISGKNLPKPSYLYGTMHLNDKRIFQTSERSMKYFEQCSIFAGELKFDEGMNMQMMNHLFMANDTTLSDLLSEEEYAFVKPKIKDKLGMMASFADKIKPIFVSVLLTDTEMLQSDRLPLDLHLQQEAKKKGIEVVGLETFDEQIKAFNSIPLTLQAEMLYQDLKDAEQNGNQTDDMIQLYAAENLDSLYKLTYETYQGDLGKVLLTNRNEKMAQRLGEMIQKQRVFAGVGAAHLLGKDGIIALLRQQGFTVEPLNK